jgi:hypothetical protein
MTDRFRDVLGSLLGSLSTQQRLLLVSLFVVSIAAGTVQGIVIRRALRDAQGLRRFAGWGWDIRMLRRSFYPPSGQHFHPTIVRLYAVSTIAMLIVFLLLVRWLLF